MISLNPSPIFPSTFPVGTFAFSNVTYAVPAAGEYDVLMGFVSTPSPRSMSIKLSSGLRPPGLVTTAVTK